MLIHKVLALECHREIIINIIQMEQMKEARAKTRNLIPLTPKALMMIDLALKANQPKLGLCKLKSSSHLKDNAGNLKVNENLRWRQSYKEWKIVCLRLSRNWQKVMI